MKKKNFRGKSSKAVTPHVVSPQISREHLADFFGLPGKSLLFAVAETHTGDGDVNITPIVVILGSKEFISLSCGEIKTHAQIRGFKQDIYPAIVLFNKNEDSFTFKSSVGSTAVISSTALTEHFGKSIIRH